MLIIEGILLACLSAIILNIGMVLQKKSVTALENLVTKPSTRTIWEARLWLVATLMTFLSYVIFFLAVERTPVSIVQPILASGVIVVVVLGMLFLDEHLSRLELVGFSITVFGVVWIGASSQSSTQTQVSINWFNLWLTVLIVLIIMIAIVVQTKIVQKNPILSNGGIYSGVCAGFSTIFVKALTILVVPFLPYLCEPSFYLVILLQIVSFSLLQMTFKVQRAVVAIPLFHSTSIIIPVIAGHFIFGETLIGWHLLGVVAIIIGTFLLARVGASVYEEQLESEIAA